jgi:hypothetical protein
MRTALIVIVLAAIACCVGFVLNTFDHRAIEWSRVFAASLGVALLLPGLALLLLPARYRAGIAWVTAAGYVGGILLALPAAVLGLFGLAGSGAQAIDFRLLLGYELCLIALAVLGTVALIRLPSGTRPVGAVAASVVALLGCAGAVLWLANTKKVNFPYDRQASVREHNDAAARKTVSPTRQRATRPRSARSTPASASGSTRAAGRARARSSTTTSSSTFPIRPARRGPRGASRSAPARWSRA